jgi:hypothetical protein
VGLPGKTWSQRFAFAAIAALLIYATLPYFAETVRAGVSVSLIFLYIAAFLLMLLVIPWTTLWLFSFAYSVVAKPYVRAWRINRIRNARELKEASERLSAKD